LFTTLAVPEIAKLEAKISNVDLQAIVTKVTATAVQEIQAEIAKL